MGSRPRRFARGILSLTAGVALAVASSAEAQQVGMVVGTVVTSGSLDPLPGARLELTELGSVTEADDEGRFSFERVPTGEVTLRVALEGYGTVVERLAVTEDEVVLVQFQLLEIAAVLDELLVRAEPSPWGHTEGLVAGGELASLTAADLLAQKLPGLTVDRPSGAIGGGSRVLIRGVSSMASNAPAIFLDGIRIDDRTGALGGSGEPPALHTLELIPASDVRQIRVLRGPAAAARYAGASNGVILIETRRGAGGGRGGRR